MYKFIFEDNKNLKSQINYPNSFSINEETLENLQFKKKENKFIKVNIESCEAFNKKNESNKQNHQIIYEDKKKNAFIDINKQTLINNDNYQSNYEKSKNIHKEETNKNKELNRSDNKLFESIGIYYIESSAGTKFYYNILHRKISFQEGNKIDNFFFEELTDLVNYQINQLEENLKKQKILAKISHEFKTPLNSIIGMISFIKNTEKKFSESVIKNLEIISNLSNYVIYLVSDIIQYVNLKDIDDILVFMTELNFKEIMKFGYQTLNCLISCHNKKQENINCSLFYDEKIDDFTAESDENRLKQIILNFVSNAVKFTREGKINLKCKLKNLENQSFIKISVKDTGIGIKEEDKIKIFKDFGMIKDESKTVKNNFGTGLGLSICKSLIEKLGLKLEFKSEYLKGSKFSILIPSKNKINSDITISNAEIILLSEKNSSINGDPIDKIIDVSGNLVLCDDNNVHAQDIIFRK